MHVRERGEEKGEWGIYIHSEGAGKQAEVVGCDIQGQ